MGSLRDSLALVSSMLLLASLLPLLFLGTSQGLEVGIGNCPELRWWEQDSGLNQVG